MYVLFVVSNLVPTVLYTAYHMYNMCYAVCVYLCKIVMYPYAT